METILAIALMFLGLILVMILIVLTYNLYLDNQIRNKREEYKYYTLRVNKKGDIQIKRENNGGGNKYPRF